jgi:hypothetical protein
MLLDVCVLIAENMMIRRCCPICRTMARRRYSVFMKLSENVQPAVTFWYDETQSSQQFC